MIARRTIAMAWLILTLGYCSNGRWGDGESSYACIDGGGANINCPSSTCTVTYVTESPCSYPLSIVSSSSSLIWTDLPARPIATAWTDSRETGMAEPLNQDGWSGRDSRQTPQLANVMELSSRALQIVYIMVQSSQVHRKPDATRYA